MYKSEAEERMVNPRSFYRVLTFLLLAFPVYVNRGSQCVIDCFGALPAMLLCYPLEDFKPRS